MSAMLNLSLVNKNNSMVAPLDRFRFGGPLSSPPTGWGLAQAVNAAALWPLARDTLEVRGPKGTIAGGVAVVARRICREECLRPGPTQTGTGCPPDRGRPGRSEGRAPPNLRGSNRCHPVT